MAAIGTLPQWHYSKTLYCINEAIRKMGAQEWKAAFKALSNAEQGAATNDEQMALSVMWETFATNLLSDSVKGLSPEEQREISCALESRAEKNFWSEDLKRKVTEFCSIKV